MEQAPSFTILFARSLNKVPREYLERAFLSQREVTIRVNFGFTVLVVAGKMDSWRC